MNLKTSTGTILRSARATAGLSIYDAAQRLGINKNTLGAYERGEREPDVDVLAAFSLRFGVPLSTLLFARLQSTGHADALEHFSEQGEPPEGFVLVPRFDVQVSGGDGALVHSEQIVDHLAFREGWVRDMGLDPLHLALVKHVGDSMEPTLQHGDLVLIDLRVNAVLDDAIYALAVDEELRCKRLQRFVDGTVTVKSDNPNYDDQIVQPSDLERLRIIGRVRWRGREM